MIIIIFLTVWKYMDHESPRSLAWDREPGTESLLHSLTFLTPFDIRHYGIQFFEKVMLILLQHVIVVLHSLQNRLLCCKLQNSKFITY